MNSWAAGGPGSLLMLHTGLTSAVCQAELLSSDVMEGDPTLP